jgi:hypothetical protein
MTQIDLLEWDGNLLKLASIIRKPVKAYLAIALVDAPRELAETARRRL